MKEMSLQMNKTHKASEQLLEKKIHNKINHWKFLELTSFQGNSSEK